MHVLDVLDAILIFFILSLVVINTALMLGLNEYNRPNLFKTRKKRKDKD